MAPRPRPIRAKTTVGMIVSARRELGLRFLDTGWMYGPYHTTKEYSAIAPLQDEPTATMAGYNRRAPLPSRYRDTLTTHMTIAIDGPVASGKTTVGRIGARTQVSRHGLDVPGGRTCRTTRPTRRRGRDECRRLTMRLVESEHGERLFVDGEDVTDQLHESQVEQGVVPVAAIRGVRRVLIHQQRSIAADGPIVMVGRDIGTMVLPDATIKVYLVASPETRAMRRYEERKNTPDSSTYDEVLYRLIHRDRIDSQRAESHPADDAVTIDTDNLDACETARRIIDLIEGA